MEKSEKNTKYNTAVKKLPKSMVEITASIPWSEVEEKRSAALKALGKNIDVKGFRKGNIPEDILQSRIGDEKVLAEAAQRALSHAYPTILREAEVQAIGQPKISITKLAEGNPLEFKVEAALMPNLELPDYKKVASEALAEERETDDTSVEEKEVEDAVEHIRRQWAKNEKYAREQKEAGDEEGVDPRAITVSEGELPKLTDEFVKQLGDFETVKDFRDRLRENMKKEKEMRGKERRRAAVLEKVVEKSEGDIPDLLIGAELDKMFAQFEADVLRAGVQMDDYLKNAGKTKEDLQKEWRGDAEKRAKTQLVLNSIAAQEKISPDKKEVGKEVEHIRKHYPDAREENIRTYVWSMLTNTAVLDFLTGNQENSKNQEPSSK